MFELSNNKMLGLVSAFYFVLVSNLAGRLKISTFLHVKRKIFWTGRVLEEVGKFVLGISSIYPIWAQGMMPQRIRISANFKSYTVFWITKKNQWLGFISGQLVKLSMENQYWILSDSNSVYLNIPFVRYPAQILRHINTTITVFWVFFLCVCVFAFYWTGMICDM